MKRPELAPGEWFVVCDRTGFRIPNTWIRREWTGALVWDRVYEQRQPQDFVTGVKDDTSVPFARPVTDPVFLATNEVEPGDL